MKRLTLALIVSVVTLTACTSTEPSATPAVIHSAGELADMAKCTDFIPSEDGDSLIAESGDCAIDGVEVHVMVFKDDEERDQWLRATEAAEYMGHLVVGDPWVIRSASINVAQQAVSATGGKLQQQSKD